MENQHFPRVTGDIMLLRRIGYPAITNTTRAGQLYDLRKLSCNKDVQFGRTAFEIQALGARTKNARAAHAFERAGEIAQRETRRDFLPWSEMSPPTCRSDGESIRVD